MTQEEITEKLKRLRYQGRWSKSALAEQAGLSRPVLNEAFDGKMSPITQTRLENLFKVITNEAPKKPRKFGAARLHFFRSYNIIGWISEFETRTGLKLFKTQHHMIQKGQGGFVCARLDYILKCYLMEYFGEKMAKKNLHLGDCYPVEQWILELEKHFPERRDLWPHLTKRRKYVKPSAAA